MDIVLCHQYGFMAIGDWHGLMIAIIQSILISIVAAGYVCRNGEFDVKAVRWVGVLFSRDGFLGPRLV